MGWLPHYVKVPILYLIDLKSGRSRAVNPSKLYLFFSNNKPEEFINIYKDGELLYDKYDILSRNFKYPTKYENGREFSIGNFKVKENKGGSLHISFSNGRALTFSLSALSGNLILSEKYTGKKYVLEPSYFSGSISGFSPSSASLEVSDFFQEGNIFSLKVLSILDSVDEDFISIQLSFDKWGVFLGITTNYKFIRS